MAAREYTSFSDGDVDKALRLVEQREAEGWELVAILPRTQHMSIFDSRFAEGVTVVMRRAAAPA